MWVTYLIIFAQEVANFPKLAAPGCCPSRPPASYSRLKTSSIFFEDVGREKGLLACLLQYCF